ncbi:hypothetical protein Droror1_Dr00023021 [Drosera rotundifolia]
MISDPLPSYPLSLRQERFHLPHNEFYILVNQPDHEPKGPESSSPCTLTTRKAQSFDTKNKTILCYTGKKQVHILILPNQQIVLIKDITHDKCIICGDIRSTACKI